TGGDGDIFARFLNLDQFPECRYDIISITSIVCHKECFVAQASFAFAEIKRKRQIQEEIL
ncbi:MAG: hypothetical protein PUE94_01175, partial [Lachnospiraceae bacterium]|nr:hypothetical protein [Lachnospiraceae bacterium]